MFMRSPLLMLAALTVGCGFNATPDGPDAEATSTSTTAIVVVERTAGPGDAVRADAVVARFVRVRGTIDDKEKDAALRLAGVAQELPAVGSCVSSLEASDSQGAARRSIDLLDVGAVSIDGKELGQRVMPDAAGIVSGVFYSKTAADTFVPGARLTLRATGGKDLTDPFLASIASPRELNDVRIVPAAGALDVVWDASDASPLDRVYVDVLGPSSRLLVRCTASDAAGHALVPSLAEEGTVAVHRVHVEPFSARGLDRGEVRFDVARLATFRR
jgi:hypothetical protein